MFEGAYPEKNVCFSRHIYAHSMCDTIKPAMIHNEKKTEKSFLKVLSFSKNRFSPKRLGRSG